MKHDEYKLQKEICRYLEIQYPRVLFLSDTIGNIKLSLLQAARNKAIQKSGFKCPDLLILKPSNDFCGLFIELKKETPFKINGELKKNEHLEAQQKSMTELTRLGYKCMFCWSFEQTKKEIDIYMSNLCTLVK